MNDANKNISVDCSVSEMENCQKGATFEKCNNSCKDKENSEFCQTCKSALETARNAAVAKAWAREVDLIKAGEGSRNWTLIQQREILLKGKVSKYHGHHMLTVEGRPDYAGCWKIIQFLTESQHKAAHSKKVNAKGVEHGSYENGKITPLDEEPNAITPKKRPETNPLKTPLKNHGKKNQEMFNLIVKNEQRVKRMLEELSKNTGKGGYGSVQELAKNIFIENMKKRIGTGISAKGKTSVGAEGLDVVDKKFINVMITEYKNACQAAAEVKINERDKKRKEAENKKADEQRDIKGKNGEKTSEQLFVDLAKLDAAINAAAKVGKMTHEEKFALRVALADSKLMARTKDEKRANKEKEMEEAEEHYATHVNELPCKNEIDRILQK